MKHHLDTAHQFWQKHLCPTNHVIDATCGNGKDTAILATLVPQGHVYALDIQEEAIIKARKNAPHPNVSFLHQCHTHLPQDERIKLVVYNLGYLPGGNKTITSQVKTTVESVGKASQLIVPGGALSIMCYPGHPEGALEESALQTWSKELCPNSYSVSWNFFKQGAPSLLLIVKIIS